MMNRYYFSTCLVLVFLFLLISCGTEQDDMSQTPGNGTAPVISEIIPNKVYNWDTIMIKGKNFTSDLSKLSVSFTGTNGKILSATNTEIKVIVPLTVNSGAVFVYRDGVQSEFATIDVLQPPFSFYQIMPKAGSPGQIVELSGTGFPADPKQVYAEFFDGKKAEVLSSTSSRITLLAPYDIDTGYVAVKIGGRWKASINPFAAIKGGKWEAMKEFPGSGRSNMSGFVIGNVIYTGFGFNGGTFKDFYKYDVTSNAWTKLTDLPAATRSSPFSFSLNGMGYVGSGYYGFNTYFSDVWQFNPATNEWLQLDDFPGTPRYDAVSFSVGNKACVGLGQSHSGLLNDFWEFDGTTKQWTKIADFPGSARGGVGVFIINNMVYLFGGYTHGVSNELWQFDPATKNFTKKKSLAVTRGARANMIAFAAKGKGVISCGWDFEGVGPWDSYQYDPATDSWKRLANYYSYNSYPFCAAVNDKGYVFGSYGANSKEVFRFTADW
jgi:hypothetical protein